MQCRSVQNVIIHLHLAVTHRTRKKEKNAACIRFFQSQNRFINLICFRQEAVNTCLESAWDGWELIYELQA